MTFVRDVWTDLVDKRLWPVALALALALVAIPVLLLKPAASPAAAGAPGADAGPAHRVTDPAAIAAARPGGPVTGKVKNPFAQQHAPKPKPAVASSGSPGPGTVGSGGDSGGGLSSIPSTGGSSGGGSSGGGSVVVAPPRPAPKPAADGEPRLKVRFGRTDGKSRVRTLAPGAPLPSRANPVLVFVEVRGGRAEFLVSSDATPEGDGRCEPSKAVCAQLFLRAGHTHFFDVTRSSGVVQYQLDVLDVVD
jgi:hypothetical protein